MGQQYYLMVQGQVGYNSPSRVFRQLGVYSVEGYNEGIEKEGAKTKGFVTSWTDSFSNMEVNLGTRLKIDNAALKDTRTTTAVISRMKPLCRELRERFPHEELYRLPSIPAAA